MKRIILATFVFLLGLAILAPIAHSKKKVLVDIPAGYYIYKAYSDIELEPKPAPGEFRGHYRCLLKNVGDKVNRFTYFNLKEKGEIELPYYTNSGKVRIEIYKYPGVLIKKLEIK